MRNTVISTRQLFVPPRIHPCAALMGRLVLPWRLRNVDHVTRVEIDDDSVARLQALAGHRVILCPNHSYEADSVVVFHLSQQLGQYWHFLSAIENFQPPMQGLMLRNIGVYSVIRGAADRRSFRCTQQLLHEGRRWLVIFPEGEIVGQNDVIGEFQPGTVQLSFWVLRAMQATQPQHVLPPIYAVPMAIKYLLTEDVRPAIRQRLARLEQKLGITTYPTDLYDRLAQIGEGVLTTAELEYGLHISGSVIFSDRVQSVKQAILTRVAREVGMVLRPEQTQVEQVRSLLLAIDRVMWVEPAATSYSRQLQVEHQRRVGALYTDLWRVLRFAASFDGYVRETMTWERMVELINLLEWELYGVKHMIGPQTAVIQVGQPLNLTAHFDAYQHNKRVTVNSLTQALEDTVGEMITQLNQRTTPIELLPQPIQA